MVARVGGMAVMAVTRQAGIAVCGRRSQQSAVGSKAVIAVGSKAGMVVVAVSQAVTVVGGRSRPHLPERWHEMDPVRD